MPDVERFITGETLSGRKLNLLVEAARASTGDGVESYEHSIGVRRTRYRPPPQFMAMITNAIPEGTPNRWQYDVEEVILLAATYDDLTIKSAGRAGTAYNMAEAMNGATGVQGNGIDVANLPAGFALQPIPIGRLVMVHQLYWHKAAVGGDAREGGYQLWFDVQNSVDGTC